MSNPAAFVISNDMVHLFCSCIEMIIIELFAHCLRGQHLIDCCLMKKVIYSICSLIVTPLLFGQLAVTEYNNNPFNGDQTTEYIEIFNFSPGSVDLTGWKVGDDSGVVFTFANGNIGSGEYLVMTRLTNNFETVWGITSAQIIANGPTLKNGGEFVTLTNSADTYTWSAGNAGSLLSVNGLAPSLVLSSSYDFSNVIASGGATTSSSDYVQAVNGVDSAFTTSSGDIGSPLAGPYSAIPEARTTALALSLSVLGLIAFRRNRKN